MSTAAGIARNAAVMIFGDTLSKVLTLIFSIYIARYLQAESYGVLSFAAALTGLTFTFTDAGFYELTVREIARNREMAGKYLGNILLFRTLLVVAALLIIYSVVTCVKSGDVTAIVVVIIIAASTSLYTYSWAFQSIFHAFEALHYVSIGKILKNIVLVVGAVVVVRLIRGDVVSVAVVYLVSSVFLLVVNIFITNRILPGLKLEVDKRLLKWMLKESFPFLLASLFSTVLYNTDRVMLSILAGDVQVGLYTAAYNLVSALNMIPIAVVAALYPVTSRYFLTSTQSLRYMFEKSLKYLAIIGAAVTMVSVECSGLVISLIYDGGYTQSSEIFGLLVLSMPFVFMSFAIINILKSINMQRILTYQTATISIVNVILNYFLIPFYGYIGASVATVTTGILGCVILLVYIAKTEYRLSKKTFVDLVEVLAFVLVSLPIIWTLNHVVVKLLVFALYPVYLVLFGIVDRTDVDLAKKLMGKN